MADHEDWTASDDAQLRGALATLRHDVDRCPCRTCGSSGPEGYGAAASGRSPSPPAAAAAAVVVGAVGFGQLGRDTTLPVTPATQSTGPYRPRRPPPRPRTAPPTPSPHPAPCPSSRDWSRTLDLHRLARLLTPVKPFEAASSAST